MKYFVFSIDIEDWFQVENLKEQIQYAAWPSKALRISENTDLVLDIMRKHDIKATFFVLGWIAERRPDLVRRIASHGHEIASHGYKHELLHLIDDTTAEDDFRKSLDILGPLSPSRIIGYRAPSFSITKGTIQLLKKSGFKYDASVNEFQFNERYGKLAILKRTCRMNDHDCNYMTLENGLVEFPVSVNKYLGVSWPLGGGYFRLSPRWFLKKQLRDIFVENDIVNIYLHPWEFDALQPRVKGLSKDYYFRHYYGLAETADKFETLIDFIKDMPGVKVRTFTEMVQSLACVS